MRTERSENNHNPDQTMVRILTNIFTSPRNMGYVYLNHDYHRELPLAAKTTALYPRFGSAQKRSLSPQDFYYKYMRSLDDEALDVVLPDHMYRRMQVSTIDMLTDHLLPMDEIERVNKGLLVGADLYRDAPMFPLGFYTCAIQQGDVLEDNLFAHEDTDIETVACILKFMRKLQISRNN